LAETEVVVVPTVVVLARVAAVFGDDEDPGVETAGGAVVHPAVTTITGNIARAASRTRSEVIIYWPHSACIAPVRSLGFTHPLW
jgi:hypothetical protein